MSNGNGRATVPLPPQAYYDFYKTNGAKSSEYAFYCEGPSMTRQEFAEECDINSIMRRYEQAGAGVNYLPRDPNVVPMYVDFAQMPSTLLEYMDLMKNAETAFMTLPAAVRREFENDPVAFVEFASDPASLEQMRTWGLAPPAKAPVVEPGSDAPAPSSAPQDAPKAS